jgi:conjugative transfer region protein TrbK
MDPTIIARAAAIVLLAGTVLACAVELARQDLTSASSLPAVDDKMDRLVGELARCKALGDDAAHDAACKAAWAQHRARFLAPRAPHQERHRVISRDTRRVEGGTQDPSRPSAINPAV